MKATTYRICFVLLLGLTALPVVFVPAVWGKQANTEANTGSAKVEGTVFVLDAAGNKSFVAGAKVKFRGPATLEAETDHDGKYVVTGVPSGTYTVEVVSPDLKAVKTVRVETGIVQVSLELKPIAVSTSVVVTSDQPKTKDPAPMGTISEETLRDAPSVNERFESSLPLIPGVVRGPDGHVNLKGTRNTQSGALVNSANVTDPVTGSPAINLPVDVVASVQVISNPYDHDTGFPHSVEDEHREYVGPRNFDRFPRFSSFDLQVSRPITLRFHEHRQRARVGVAAFNLFNHFDPRDVQNNRASARFGEFFNSSWREYRGKFVLEF